MKLLKNGNNTLNAEIANITKNGIWILVNNLEYFMPYSEYPWFKDKSISSIFNIKQNTATHLYWPDLDMDLELECLSNPSKFPLSYK